MPTLAPLDYAVVAIYLVIVIVVSIRVTRRTPDAEGAATVIGFTLVLVYVFR